MAHTPLISSSYFEEPFRPKKLNQFLAAAKQLLQDVEFDAIVFRGVSGALVAPVLAYHLEKSLIVVRKPETDEDTHSRQRVEGDYAAKRYIIVDDFMASGKTVSKIMYDIFEHFNHEAVCVGALFYQWHMRYGDDVQLKPSETLPGYKCVCEMQKKREAEKIAENPEAPV